MTLNPDIRNLRKRAPVAGARRMMSSIDSTSRRCGAMYGKNGCKARFALWHDGRNLGASPVPVLAESFPVPERRLPCSARVSSLLFN